MLSVILQIAVCVAGLFLVLGTWYMLQAYARRRSGCPGDLDLLEYMAHGCAACNKDGHCGRVRAAEERHDHEPV